MLYFYINKVKNVLFLFHKLFFPVTDKNVFLHLQKGVKSYKIISNLKLFYSIIYKLDSLFVSIAVFAFFSFLQNYNQADRPKSRY